MTILMKEEATALAPHLAKVRELEAAMAVAAGPLTPIREALARERARLDDLTSQLLPLPKAAADDGERLSQILSPAGAPLVQLDAVKDVEAHNRPIQHQADQVRKDIRLLEAEEARIGGAVEAEYGRLAELLGQARDAFALALLRALEMRAKRLLIQIGRETMGPLFDLLPHVTRTNGPAQRHQFGWLDNLDVMFRDPDAAPDTPEFRARIAPLHPRQVGYEKCEAGAIISTAMAEIEAQGAGR